MVNATDVYTVMHNTDVISIVRSAFWISVLFIILLLGIFIVLISINKKLKKR
jgi:uncharacterized protein (DUF58 family)